MQSGFVSIIGNPNAGKSTLLNTLLGEDLCITTPKAQTTRHRILGILNGENYQIVFSDTPGMVNPHYKLQETMLQSVEESVEDADVFVLISDRGEEFKNTGIIQKIKQTGVPILLLINKIDLSDQTEIEQKIEQLTKQWDSVGAKTEIIPISALHKFNTEVVIKAILRYLPEHPAYYPQDEISDRNTRFFVSEIIREKILKYYQKEIPYSADVVVAEYVEEKNIDRIRALIFVEKESQKGIIIGPKGVALKRVGTEARKKIENFTGKKVYLEIQVKVLKNWRNEESILKQLGYKS